MLDEIRHLRDCPVLQRLLAHYAQVSSEDKRWQDRLMQLEGVEPAELVQLHGELIAFDWIEQNTGVVTALRPGAVLACYRITLDGQRALRRLARAYNEEDDLAEAA